MKLSNIWFSALSENEEGQMLWITGRDDIEAFKSSGKFKERAEVTWKYSPDSKGLPSNGIFRKLFFFLPLKLRPRKP